MSNLNPYRIKPEERGHRKRLSEEKSIRYTIVLPESLFNWCKKAGTFLVRAILEKESKADT